MNNGEQDENEMMAAEDKAPKQMTTDDEPSQPARKEQAGVHIAVGAQDAYHFEEPEGAASQPVD